MKKQTKLFTTLSAAALLTIGVSAVSMAAGWDNSTGEWRYLNNDGTEVTDAWKSANGNWFYLNSDGVMATNQLIEDTNNTTARYYYVDQYGAMVKNTWKAVAMDDSSSDLDAEYYWYYFGSDGKAYTSKDELGQNEIKTINGQKYAFDSEGRMLYGWINDENVQQQDGDNSAWETSQYFFNGWNDGHMQTGWLQMTVEDDNESKDYWFYFGNDGKKVGHKKGKRKKINGAYYHFADDGHMITGWGTATQTVKESAATSGQLSYLNGDGSERKNKWVWAVPDEDSVETDLQDNYNDDEYNWWYFNNSGKLVTNQIKKINGKSYAFDYYGRMLKAFVVKDSNGDIFNGGSADAVTRAQVINGELDKRTLVSGDELYWFSNDKEKDGSMKKGYQTLELNDGSYQFYFNSSNGKAENGYVGKIKKYVLNGLVLAPSSEDDSNYAAVIVDANNKPVVNSEGECLVFEEKTLGNILVNKSGSKITKKTKLKDSADNYYVVNNKGVVIAFYPSEEDYNKAFTYTTTDANNNEKEHKCTVKTSMLSAADHDEFVDAVMAAYPNLDRSKI